MVTDPITDMINSIKNAGAVGHPKVLLPYSNLKFEVAKILEKNMLIAASKQIGKKTKKLIEIELKYEDGDHVISGIRRISKPGQRIYLPAKSIRRVKGGYGIAIISTSRGLMTDKEARRQRVGGEVMCEVW